MNVVAKSSSIASLGLGQGVHWLKVVVADETVAYEVATPMDPPAQKPRQWTGFVEKWGGTARKMDVPGDVWLAHINEKHLR